MLEKTEGAIHNGQSRDNGNTGNTRRRQTKHNTENYKDEQHGPHQNPGVNQGVPEGYAVPASHRTPTMLLIKLWHVMLSSLSCSFTFISFLANKLLHDPGSVVDRIIHFMF